MQADKKVPGGVTTTKRADLACSVRHSVQLGYCSQDLAHKSRLHLFTWQLPEPLAKRLGGSECGAAYVD